MAAQKELETVQVNLLLPLFLGCPHHGPFYVEPAAPLASLESNWWSLGQFV